MIFHHRAVSLAVIGSVAVLGGNSGAGSAVVSAAATDHHPQHNLAIHNIVYQKSKKETTTATMTRARRAKKTKASVSDNLSMDSLPATTRSTYGAIDSRAADGIAATATGAGGDSSGSSKSTKSAKNTQAVSETQDNPLNYAGADGGIGDESTTIVVNPAELTAAPTTAKLPTAAPTDLPTLLIENKIYDEDVLVLPLGVNRDDNDGTETVISTVDEEEVELKAIDKWNFYMDHVPEDGPEQQPRGQEGGQEDGGLKATDQFSFYTEHNKKDGGDIATRTGDDDDDDGDVGDGRGGSNDEGTQAADEGASIVLKPIDDTQFYEDYVPDEGVGLDSDDEEGEVEEEEPEDEADVTLRTIDMDPSSVATTPTVSPTTSAPTMKPTNAPIVPPPPLPTNAPIVPPPPIDDPAGGSISSKAATAPEDSCFEENGVEVCITYHADLSCDMKVDGMTCDCCRYNPALGFISTFDCTNIGEQWGKMGLCEPGPMPVEEDKKKNRNKDDTIEEDALSILSLEYGDDETDIAADAISLAWSTAGTDSEATSTDSIASIAWLQRRGRRRAQAVRRKTAATKKRREAMTK